MIFCIRVVVCIKLSSLPSERLTVLSLHFRLVYNIYTYNCIPTLSSSRGLRESMISGVMPVEALMPDWPRERLPDSPDKMRYQAESDHRLLRSAL